MTMTTLADRYDRATFAFEMRDYRTAAELLEELVLAEPDNIAVRLLLARAYFHSARLRPAEDELREVIARDPSETYAYLMLGRVLQRQSRHDEAAGPLRIAAAMNGDLDLDELLDRRRVVRD
jgi:predicted Zn-dependent protease